MGRFPLSSLLKNKARIGCSQEQTQTEASKAHQAKHIQTQDRQKQQHTTHKHHTLTDAVVIPGRDFQGYPLPLEPPSSGGPWWARHSDGSEIRGSLGSFSSQLLASVGFVLWSFGSVKAAEKVFCIPRVVGSVHYVCKGLQKKCLATLPRVLKFGVNRCCNDLVGLLLR